MAHVKATKQNLITLLRRMETAAWDLADADWDGLPTEEQRVIMQARYKQEALCFCEFRMWLTDPEFFNDIWHIYFKDEDEEMTL